ncbi:MAG: hypothetical protein LBO82_06550 [Synergistaceae bacterium]|jgi:hypothetical protein|nr:hypothetical protein [Synergistaceae bacterium]
MSAGLWLWYQNIASSKTVGDAERYAVRLMESRPGDGRKMNAVQAAWAKRRLAGRRLRERRNRNEHA